MSRAGASLLRVPILKGRLRGWWWLPGSGGKVLRVLLGSYEPAQSALFERRITLGAVVFDLGAHVGYYTLLASSLVGPRGRVYAFEPSPCNLLYLREHLRLNRRTNVEVVAAAVADRGGEGYLAWGTGSGTGHLAAEGALRVRTVAIDEFVAEAGRPPDVLKIDVEGAELLVLEGARETLARQRPIIFLSTHGGELREGCSALLRSLDYRIEPIAGRGDELLCTPAHIPRTGDAAGAGQGRAEDAD